MPDPKAYMTRAALAGPMQFAHILVEGLNAYTKPINDLVNAAPSEDLPLIIETLERSAKLLRTECPDDTLSVVSGILDHCIGSRLVSAEVPVTEDDEA